MLKGAIVHFQLEVIMKHCSTAMLSHGEKLNLALCLVY